METQNIAAKALESRDALINLSTQLVKESDIFGQKDN